MPTPPPKPTPEGKQGGANRRRRKEAEQIERALRDQGPADRDTVNRLVGGTYWEEGRFDKALGFAKRRRGVVEDSDGRYRVG